MNQFSEKKTHTINTIRASEKNIENKEFASALDLLETCKNFFYESYRYNLAMGKAYLGIGNNKKGIFHLMKCSQLEPLNEVAVKILVEYHLGYNKTYIRQKHSTVNPPYLLKDFQSEKSDSQTKEKSRSQEINTLVTHLKSLSYANPSQTAQTQTEEEPKPSHSENKTESHPDSEVSSNDIDIGKLAHSLSNAKMPHVEETNEPTPIEEQKKPVPDSDAFTIPTRELAKIFIDQNSYKRAINVYKALAIREPHNKDLFEIVISSLQEKL